MGWKGSRQTGKYREVVEFQDRTSGSDGRGKSVIRKEGEEKGTQKVDIWISMSTPIHLQVNTTSLRNSFFSVYTNY